jgi:hypothetical protein
MAAIEKICEYSGDYEQGVNGFNMYKAKDNQLQIMPKYRKLFRGANVVLSASFYGLDSVRKIVGLRSTEKIMYRWSDDTEANPNNPLSFKSFVQYDKRINKRKCEVEFFYTLHVFDEHLKGEVKGNYSGWTTNLSTLRRKLRRLTRNYKLKVKVEKTTLQEFGLKQIPRFFK